MNKYRQIQMQPAEGGMNNPPPPVPLPPAPSPEVSVSAGLAGEDARAAELPPASSPEVSVSPPASDLAELQTLLQEAVAECASSVIRSIRIHPYPSVSIGVHPQ